MTPTLGQKKQTQSLKHFAVTKSKEVLRNDGVCQKNRRTNLNETSVANLERGEQENKDSNVL